MAKNEVHANRKILIVMIVAAVVILAVIISHVIKTQREKGLSEANVSEETVAVENAGDVNKGIDFLEEMEAVDANSVESRIRTQEQEEQEAKREEMFEEIEEGSGDLWGLFSNAVVLGDSRAMGFSDYQYLPEERVFAENGDTVDTLEEYLDEIRELNPQYIFICYGMNDILKQMEPTGDAVAAIFKEELAKLHSAVPDAEIYINSILPATDEAIETKPGLSTVPEVNDALEKLASEEGYGWVDCDDIVAENTDMYDQDGIHFTSDFYPIWAKQMMMTVYAPESGTSETYTYNTEEVSSSSAENG